MLKFDEILRCCPDVKQAIDEKIAFEVSSRDVKIAALEKTIDELTATILMGGVV